MAGARDFPEMDPQAQQKLFGPRQNSMFVAPDVSNGIETTERPMARGEAAQFGVESPPMEAPTNPNFPNAQPRGGMPGVSVGERPMTTADARAFGIEPAAPGSPEGMQFRNANFGNQGPMPPKGFVPPAPADTSFLGKIKSAGHAIAESIGDPLGKTGEAVKGALGKTGLVAGAGLGAYEMGSGLRDGDMGRAGFGAADTAATFGLTNPVTAGPSGMYLGGRAAYAAADHFMPQRMKDELGDTVGRAIDSVVPSWMGGATPSARAGFDRIQEAENRGRNIVTGSAYIPKPDVAAPARQGTVYPAGNSTAGGGRGSVNPPMASATGDARPDLANIASLGGGTGTAVPGTTDIRKFKTADGRTLYSNVAGGDNDKLMSGKPGVQTIPGMGGAGGAGGSGGAGSSGLRDVASLSAENRALGGDPSALMTTPGLAYGGSGKTIFDSNKEDAAAQNLGPSLAEDRALSARQRRQFATEERGQNQQMDIARMNNATQRDATARTVGATLRGQDLTYDSSMYSHNITGANARARLQYDMGKDKFDRGMRTAEFNQKQEEADFTHNEKSTKDLHEEIGNMLPPDPTTGKPDGAAVSRAAQGINAHIAAQQQVLRQNAAKGDTKAAAALADLQKNGPAALDPTWKRNFVLGQTLNDLSKQYGSGRLNMVGGTAVVNDVNVSGIRRKHNMILPDEYDLLDEHGQPSGATVPARAIHGDGSFTPLGRSRTDLLPMIRK